MRIICKIDYTRYTAELSGSELDTFTKILGKLISIQEHTIIDGMDILVMPTTPRKPPVETIVLSDCKMQTQADYERAEAAKKQVEIAKAVSGYVVTGKLSDKEFVMEIYYQQVVTYNEKEKPTNVRVIAGGDVEVTVLDKDDEPSKVVIYSDGTYTREATAD